MIEPQTHHVILQRGEEIIEFDLKEPLWIEDQALQMQCINKNGDLVQRDLFLKRLEAATGKSTKELVAMPNWILSALTLKWLMLFDGTSVLFLDSLPVKQEKDSSSSSTLPKQDSL